MHIIETYFECGGFDHRLIQGGTSVYLWNLARSLARQDHRVSIVAPAHGRLDDLRRLHDVEDLDYSDRYRLPLVLDRRTWREGFADEIDMNLTTTAHRLRLDGVDLYFLSNEMLDRLPDRMYPPYESKGNDLVFFKPLVYQVDSIRFIRHRFADERAIVHAHEPFYHYLMPAAFRDDPTKLMVSTVQSNMPITKSVYRPEVETLLAFLGTPVELPPVDPPPPADLAVPGAYQQLTHLHYEYPPDHVRIHDLVAEHADLVGFLSAGQQRFQSDLADTPFEQVFRRLPVADVVRRNAYKHFEAGCAVGDAWTASRGALARAARSSVSDFGTVDRAAVLTGLGLDPALPTFFHNARFAVHHKGQIELIRAVGRVLDEGAEANFILRCLSDFGLHPLFDEVAARHPGRLYVETARIDDKQLMQYAAAADFCVFPSKFEMDTFLIAQGEAMAAGAVPIATAQLGMAHYGHVADPLTGPHAATATGWAVGRSFAEDDPLLVAALVDRIHGAIRLWHDDPAAYARLSVNAVANARQFTWERCARRHLAAFEPLWNGVTPELPVERALEHGWFDLLDTPVWTARPDEIAEAALRWGDLDAYRRVRELNPAAAERFYDAAWARADLPACRAIAAEFPDLATRLRERYALHPDGLRYRLPHAARVDLVLPGAATGGRALPTVRPMVRQGDWFRVAVTEPGPWHLLITLPDGRCAWDLLSPEPGDD
ncbi:glycosyltransferase [Hamadaea tsunoensis]|uniref:glycosyltransferase n=1 Tax=Hamadaea tsunoensis TaxID=53368 RepID=UPI000411F850|nr:glycosyltransferase [Hamadaea tsunoensis]